MTITVNGRTRTLSQQDGEQLLENVMHKALSGGYAIQQCGPAHWVGVHPNGGELEVTATRVAK